MLNAPKRKCRQIHIYWKELAWYGRSPESNHASPSFNWREGGEKTHLPKAELFGRRWRLGYIWEVYCKDQTDSQKDEEKPEWNLHKRLKVHQRRKRKSGEAFDYKNEETPHPRYLPVEGRRTPTVRWNSQVSPIIGEKQQGAAESSTGLLSRRRISAFWTQKGTRSCKFGTQEKKKNATLNRCWWSYGTAVSHLVCMCAVWIEERLQNRYGGRSMVKLKAKEKDIGASKSSKLELEPNNNWSHWKMLEVMESFSLFS